jgi:hypothetical protein
MVSAQDFKRSAPLHEMDASWNNTVKHVQSETVMGEIPCRYAVEMGTVMAGSKEELRRRPTFSLTVCTIAPLVQDTHGIEGALVLAEAGVPVGFLAMPTLGTTAPATMAGALVMADAEVISACVLMQLHAPGAPVFHSIMQAWADPRSGAYLSYSLDSRCRYAPVEMATIRAASLGACLAPTRCQRKLAVGCGNSPRPVSGWAGLPGDRHRDGSLRDLYPALPGTDPVRQ